jgi:glucose-1-phosphate cytidylyltransferase
MRLRGAAGALPKPMVPIGGRPLLWHIMRYYAHFGHRDFVVCVGHQADVIRNYFEQTQHGWRIHYVDTGLDSSIGERFYAVRDQVAEDEVFLANYGDTVTDAPLPLVIDQHVRSGRVASLLSVRPNYTFNVVTSEGARVTAFADIAQSGIRVNGGYFVFRRDVFDYILAGEDLPAMFARLIADGQLSAYVHDGFWAPMDTLKDKERLELLVASGGSVWQVWEAARRRSYPAGDRAPARA